MASKVSVVSFSLCLLLLLHGSVAQFENSETQQQRGFRQQRECRIENIKALEPSQRVQSEAGVTEYWDQNDEQFECAGVEATLYTIQPKGLLLPEYANAPRLIYILQGEGFTGEVIPGCPESFQSIRQSEEYRERQGREQRYGDQHQKIRQFRRGDVIAIPAGVPHWCYNNGDTPVVAFAVLDTSSHQNQLDQNLRKFHIAGVEQSQQQQKQKSVNIFRGFAEKTLADAIGVSVETARKLQSENDRRGNIVLVEKEIRAVRPTTSEEQEGRRYNGMEETICNLRLIENVADPARADVYSPQGGLITSVNDQKLPILNNIQMSAERGVLYSNALFGPKWVENAHKVVYITRGSGRMQIVGNSGRSVFDEEVSKGQLVIIPQNFVSVTKAGNQGFEYIAFNTNRNAITHPIVGKASAFRGIPDEVLMNSYRISREEARDLKYRRGEELKLFGARPRRQEERASI